MSAAQQITGCAHCNNTGNIGKDPHGQLDCVSCTTASERAQLNAWARLKGFFWYGNSLNEWDLWQIYKHGYAAGFEAGYV